MGVSTVFEKIWQASVFGKFSSYLLHYDRLHIQMKLHEFLNIYNNDQLTFWLLLAPESALKNYGTKVLNLPL